MIRGLRLVSQSETQIERLKPQILLSEKVTIFAIGP